MVEDRWFCSSCGERTTKHSSYCSSCGVALSGGRSGQEAFQRHPADGIPSTFRNKGLALVAAGVIVIAAITIGWALLLDGRAASGNGSDTRQVASVSSSAVRSKGLEAGSDRVAREEETVRGMSFGDMAYPIPEDASKDYDVPRMVSLESGRARIPTRANPTHLVDFEISSEGPWYCDFDEDGREEAFLVVRLGPHTAANPGAWEALGYLVQSNGSMTDVLYTRTDVGNAYDRAFGTRHAAHRMSMNAESCVVRAQGFAEGPACCPAYSFRMHFGWKDSRLVPIGSPSRRKFDSNGGG